MKVKRKGLSGTMPPDTDELCTFKVNALIECLTAIIEYQSILVGDYIASTVHCIK